jgi:hypothetical protein
MHPKCRRKIMLRDHSSRGGIHPWALAAGTALGAAAAMLLFNRLRRRRFDSLPLSPLEDAVIAHLRGDETLGERPIDVAEVAPGLIELAGTVKDVQEARRAVAAVQTVDGVGTVVNRIVIGDVEARLAHTRRRFRDGDPRLHETQVYGMGVGFGRRRQSSDTDPDRPDDHVRMRERAIGREMADEQPSPSR